MVRAVTERKCDVQEITASWKSKGAYTPTGIIEQKWGGNNAHPMGVFLCSELLLHQHHLIDLIEFLAT